MNSRQNLQCKSPKKLQMLILANADSLKNLQYVIIGTSQVQNHRSANPEKINCVHVRVRVGQCTTVFSILRLFIYLLNEAACPPFSTVYSPVMPSEGIYTLMRVH